jgi:uncharacterized membrane protein YhhN
LLISAAVILLLALLFFDAKESVPGKLASKTPLSALFILLAFLQGGAETTYSQIMLVGFSLCLLGDVLLIFPQKKLFLVGLIAFLAGHVFYILGFLSLSGFSTFTLLPSMVVLVASFIFLRWLKPHLGSMKIPVISYVLVISVMMIGASFVLFDEALPEDGRIILFLGALLFYLSDLFVARQRFVTKEFINRLMGLPLYYSGQFLLAFSMGLIGN